MVTPFRKLYDKVWVGFYLNTGKRFLLDVSFWRQQKELPYRPQKVGPKSQIFSQVTKFGPTKIEGHL